MKEVLITSSVLIAVILLLRRLFRKRVSQRLIYAAWLLVALRLLIPVQFGQFQFSIATLTEQTEARSQPIRQAQQALQEPVAGPSREELYDQLLNDYLQENPAPEVPGTDLPQADTPTITPEIQQTIEAQVEEQLNVPTVADILTAVWIVGICGMAAWLTTANLLFLSRAKKGSFPLSGQDGKTTIRVSAGVPTPCLVGLFRPVIYLTSECADDEQMRNHVLAHERTHLRHGDHIWALLRCICLCVYWFNPLVWIAAGQSRRDCELACDESVLKKLGDQERIAYGKTLLDTVAHSLSPVCLLETATAMNETKKQLTERVNFIVKKRKNLLIAAICLILMAAIVAGCTFTGSVPYTTAPTKTTPTVTPLVNGSVTKPGFRRVYLLTEVSNYYADGDLYIQHSYTYDENGRLLTMVYNSGTSSSLNQTFSYSYDQRDLLTTISIESYRVGSSSEYGYDQFSLVNYHNYAFDDAGRLTTFEVTSDGETTRSTFAYDSLGRLILRTKERPRGEAERNHFIYDADGNLSKIVTPRVTTQDLYDHDFAYDEQGRLISLSNGLGTANNRIGTTLYEYDDQGHILRETHGNWFDLAYSRENGVLTAIGNTTPFDTDQSYEVDEFGNVTRIIQEDGRWTEFKYIAADLPDEYAQRALLRHRVVAPRDPLAAYRGDIMEYFMPYGMPTIRTWDDLS